MTSQLINITVISNEAGRRFFFSLRSCEVVGQRSEKSLFDFSAREHA
jgi:hypothetical protein